MTLLGLAPDKEYSLGETEDNERQLFSFCNKINDRIHQQINTIRIILWKLNIIIILTIEARV